MNKVRVLQRGLYRAAKVQKERRFGVNADAGHATSRETCMRNVGYINYGERCFDIGLHADRRNLSGSRMRENLTYGSRWQGMETGIG